MDLLLVHINATGNLVIRALEPIAAFALKKWHEDFKVDKATLEIQIDVVDMAELQKTISADLNEFKRWKKEQKEKYG